MKFETETINLDLHPEKGFKYGKGTRWGILTELVEVIEAHGWKDFIEHPEGFCTPLVREFYANVSSKDQTFVVIRGGKLSFSAETINMKLRLEDVEDEYGAILNKVTEKQLQQSRRIWPLLEQNGFSNLNTN